MPRDLVGGTPLLLYVLAWSSWWSLFMFWRILAPRQFAENESQLRRELGLSTWYKHEAFRGLVAALGFLVAWRWADLAVLWIAFAALSALLAAGLFLASLAARSQSEQIAQTISPADGTSIQKRPLTWRFQPLGLLLLAVWVYAWRELAA
jgi:hypothetical protein